MKRTFKKSLALLLTLVMVLSLIPAMSITAAASGPDSGSNVLTIDGTTPASGEGWSWNGSILTLSGVSLSGIDLSVDATILLEGANKIEATAGSGISSTGNLTIKGSGTLEVSSTGDAIQASGKNITVNSGKITCTSTTGIGIFSGGLTINGGYISAVSTANNNNGVVAPIVMNGGYLYAEGGCRGTFGNSVTVNGGYMEAYAKGGQSTNAFGAIVVNNSFENSGGVVKAVATSSTKDIGISTNGGAKPVTLSGGVTIARGGAAAISSEATIAASNDEKYWPTTADGSVTGSSTDFTTTAPAGKNLVIAKEAYSAQQTGLTTLNGTYIKVASGSAFSPTAKSKVTGGSYLEGEIGADLTTADADLEFDVSLRTLVCYGTTAGVRSVAGTDLTMASKGTLCAFASSGYGVNAKGYFDQYGNAIAVGTAGGFLLEAGATLYSGYVFGYGTGEGSVGITYKTSLAAYECITAQGKGIGLSFTGGGNPGFSSYHTDVTCIGGTQAFSGIATEPTPPNGKETYGSTAAPGALAKATYDTSAMTYKINGEACKVVYWFKDLPTTFDARNGTIVNEKPATNPTWNDYTFAGWYTGIDGRGEQLFSSDTPKAGTTYYAKWTRSIDYMTRTVITTPLDFTGSTTPTLPEKCGIELWVGEEKWDGTGVWAGDWINITGTIDCSNTKDCEYALKLPAGVTLGCSNSIIKAGSKDGKSVGIQCAGALTITSYDSTLDVTAADVTGGSSSTIYSYGIDATELTIEGDSEFGVTVSVTATAGTSMKTDGATSVDSTSAGVKVGENGGGTVTIKEGGSLTASASTATGSATASQGIRGKVSMSAGSLTASSSDQWGKAVSGTITTTGTPAVRAGDDASAEAITFTSGSTLTQKYVNISFIESYPVWLAGVQLNENNVGSDGAVTIAGVTGGLTYTPAANGDAAVLALNGATIPSGVSEEDKSYAAIYTTADLTLTLAGDNSVTDTKSTVYALTGASSLIWCNGSLDLTIREAATGSGAALNVTSRFFDYGFMLTNADMKLECGAVTVSATSYGVAKASGSSGTLTVNGGSLNVTATAGYSGVGIDIPATINGGTVVASGGSKAFSTAPTISSSYANVAVKAGYYEEAADEDGYIETLDDETYTGNEYVWIGERITTYPVWVGGVRVTELNADDVLGDSKVSYTPAVGTKGEENYTPAVLALNGATITSGASTIAQGFASIYTTTDLTLTLAGDNSVTDTRGAGTEDISEYATAFSAILVSGTDANLTIREAASNSGASLNVDCTSFGCGIDFSEREKMTLESGSVAVSAKRSGINGKVTISGGSLNASGIGPEACGINGAVTISDGSLNASGEGAEACGIFGSVTINGGTVTASGTASAFFSAPNLAAYTDCTVKAGDDAGSAVEVDSPVATTYTGNKYVWIGKAAAPPPPPILDPVTTPSAPVEINGKREDIGEVETIDNDDGTKDTIVKLDPEKLDTKINETSDGAEVKVNIPETTGDAAAELVVQNLDEMAKKDITLTINSGGVTYTVPTTAIDTEALMEELGATDPAEVPISVTIAKVGAKGTEAVKANAEKAGAELIGAPIEFIVTASYNGKAVEVTRFESYVQRVIEITEAQAKQVTTAVAQEPSGALRHVPTEVFSKDGKWYARVNSLTNSTYALISCEAGFADDDGKWFEAVAAEMASRGIIDGRGEGLFDGEASITRAEFATIIVRALGLPETGDASAFSDVAKDAWYYGAVGKAYEYGLIEGRGDGVFDPNAKITRQEAMQLIFNAAKVAEFTGMTGALTAFTDAANVSDWASAAAQFNVGSGLVQGDAGLLRPLDNISRGESATMILRLLQKSGLVDVRTEA